jgi:hypothetical protein
MLTYAREYVSRSDATNAGGLQLLVYEALHLLDQISNEIDVRKTSPY